MRLVEFFDITEVKITKVRHGMKPTPVTVWINPTPNELLQLWQNKGGQRFRGITDEEGNTFWWNAYDFIHPQMAEQLGIDKIMPDGWYLFGDFQDKTVPALVHYLSAGETRKHASKVPSMRPFLKHPGFRIYPIEVTEAKVIKAELEHSARRVPVIVNPGTNELLTKWKNTPDRVLRGITDTDGNSYWWDAGLSTHKSIADSLGIRIKNGWHLFKEFGIWDKVKLAHHISVNPQEVEKRVKKDPQLLALLKHPIVSIWEPEEKKTSKVTEGKIIDTPKAKLILNPSRDEFWGLVNRTKKFIDSGTAPPNARRVRSEALLKGLLHPETGDVFIWDPFMTIHVEVANYLLSNYYGEKPSVQAWANITGAEPNDSNPVYYENAGLIPFALGFWYKDRGDLDVYVDYDQTLNHPRLKRLVSNPVITEARISDIGGIKMIFNPTKQEFWGLIKRIKRYIDAGKLPPNAIQSSESLIKGVLHPETGDLIIWDPFEATHDQAIVELIDEYYGEPPDFKAWSALTGESYDEYEDDNNAGFIAIAVGYGYGEVGRTDFFVSSSKAANHPKIKALKDSAPVLLEAKGYKAGWLHTDGRIVLGSSYHDEHADIIANNHRKFGLSNEQAEEMGYDDFLIFAYSKGWIRYYLRFSSVYKRYEMGFSAQTKTLSKARPTILKMIKEYDPYHVYIDQVNNMSKVYLNLGIKGQQFENPASKLSQISKFLKRL